MSRYGYDFYLGCLLLPVSPAKLQIRIKNRNETVSLLDGGEINLLRAAGLTEIEFEFLLPQTVYPFARRARRQAAGRLLARMFAVAAPYGVISSGMRTTAEPFPASEYLTELERLKVEKKPFQFIVSRMTPAGRMLFSTNMTVSLEEYTVTEDAENGTDLQVKVRLRQYRAFGTKTVKLVFPEKEEETGTPAPETPAAPEPAPARAESTVQPEKPITIGCDVLLNGQVHRDSYGNGPGAVFSNYRGKINFINGAGSHPYHVTTPAGGWLGWVAAGCVKAV